ncbi:MAG: hypothetical protein M3Q10_14475, partial [Chloroflexota bacterium]|nr:hypothetical protein [Chloroflexota bacterium]
PAALGRGQDADRPVQVRLSSGPFVGQRVLGLEPSRAWCVYLGGPAGNPLLAAVAYGAFLAQPLPLLRLLAEVQLAAVGYALLPFDPLDGGPLGRCPGVLAALGLFTAVAGVLFTLGMM